MARCFWPGRRTAGRLDESRRVGRAGMERSEPDEVLPTDDDGQRIIGAVLHCTRAKLWLHLYISRANGNNLSVQIATPDQSDRSFGRQPPRLGRREVEDDAEHADEMGLSWLARDEARADALGARGAQGTAG